MAFFKKENCNVCKSNKQSSAVYVRSERIGKPDKVAYLPVGLAYVAYEAAGLDIHLHFPVAEREFFLRPPEWNFEE